MTALNRTRPLRRILLRGLAGAVAIACIYAAYCAVLIQSGNVHALAGGQIYRSAQLDAADLQAVVTAHGIRAVLNLRGANPGQDWYDTEIAATRSLGVLHYDIGISARQVPTAAQLTDIVEIMRTAPKPLLIHCQAGADRSGLAAALYRFAVVQEPAADAAGELSLRYAHFPYLFNRTGAMDDAFDAYVLAAGRS